MGQFSRDIVEASNMLFRRGAPQQVAVTSGGLKPATFSGLEPIALWVFQTLLIIVFTEILSSLFARIRLPRVMAEVISGVILGPTILGRIPNFTNMVFPPHSIHVLAHISTFGLFFFLFIVCLNVDPSVARRKIKLSLAIFLASLIPLLIGAALAVYMYHNFAEPSVNFAHFVLLVAVAVGITAFPVLCRILTEVDLLGTDVGVVVLSAGIGNDAIGWILLALTVVFANTSPHLTMPLMLLLCISCYTLVLLPAKFIFRWVAQRTRSLERNEPTPFIMGIILAFVLFVALFTSMIDVHPIFVAFITGFIIPKDNGFAISVAKKMEGLFTFFFLPQYFALSGLMLDLSHLKNGITWGFTILICVVAFLVKFVPCSMVAKKSGFALRESCAVGMLMSCKSLVEIIILNVGLQAKILDPRVFTMLVLHALVLTIITIPLTILIYPSPDRFARPKFVLVLYNIEQLPSAMTLAQLLRRPFTSNPSSVSETISINTILGVELTERTSAASTSQVAVISDDEISTRVADRPRDSNSQMVVVLWPLAHPTPESSISSLTADSNSSESPSSRLSGADNAASPPSQFIGRVFTNSPSDVARFIDRRLWNDRSSTTPHVFLPFFGGPDDHLALSLVIRLCMHEGCSATAIRFRRLESGGNVLVDSTGDRSVPRHDEGTPDDIRLEILGDSLCVRGTSSAPSSNAEIQEALARISFKDEWTDRPLHRMLELANEQASRTSNLLLVVAGRSRRMATSIGSHRRELDQLISERNTSLPSDVAETFGDVASAFVLARGSESLIVTQARQL